jgi:hypothetical protein
MAMHLPRAAERVAHDSLVAICAKEQADGRCVLGLPELVVDRADVEVEPAGEARLELADLELDDVARLLDVEEDQLDGEVVAVDLEAHPVVHEREPPTGLGEGLRDPVHGRPTDRARRRAADAEDRRRRVARELPGEHGLDPSRRSAKTVGAARVARRCLRTARTSMSDRSCGTVGR